jgi:hypothetical protein
MTINEVKNVIMGIEGAAMARTNKSNFVVIPCEDGIAKIEVKAALAQDTKNHAAFNLEAAVAEYKTWEAEAALRAAERAAKPKIVKGPNPEAQARRDALDAAIVAMPAFAGKTATDVFNALPEGQRPKTVMMVGSALKRLAEAGIVTTARAEDPKDQKSYYTKG